MQVAAPVSRLAPRNAGCPPNCCPGKGEENRPRVDGWMPKGAAGRQQGVANRRCWEKAKGLTLQALRSSEMWPAKPQAAASFLPPTFLTSNHS